ncbi:C6 zinc finger domain protein [Phlyctema vagabunda]|uniref:C6 zinc finger domain protein n=1 Tax=Phlyctema vagabunda TaxID=108571 RepID=A0ABR4PEG7_9HELO
MSTPTTTGIATSAATTTKTAKNDSTTSARKRAKTPRARTGCLTCRIRHVKCDERKPQCRNCTNTRRVCDGYTANRRVPNQNLRLSVADPAASASLNLAAVLPDDFHERRHFSFFETRTAAEFSGYFDLDFWGQLVLQLSRSQPAVRHIVIALGTLHERLQKGNGDLGEWDELKHYSVLQYNKAIGHLNAQLSGGERQSTGVTLICCILFICFETLQKNYDSTFRHLKAGLSILRQWQDANLTSGRKLVNPEEKFIEENLAHLFTRLDIQATSFVEDRPPQLSMSHRFPGAGPDMPSIFCSMEEARDWLDVTRYWFYNVRSTKTWTENSETSLKLCQQWGTAFDAYMRRSSKQMRSAQIRAASMLKIIHLLTSILTGTQMSMVREHYEPYNAQFENIASLAASLIEASSGGNDAAPAACGFRFSFDMGVIAPLYFVATSAYAVPTRLRAIALLRKTTRREGIWDPKGAARLAQEVFNGWRGEVNENGVFDIPWQEAVEPEKDEDWQNRMALFKGVSGMNKQEAASSPDSLPGSEDTLVGDS